MWAKNKTEEYVHLNLIEKEERKQIEVNPYDELDFADNNKGIDKTICEGKILKKFVHDHSLNVPS